MPKKSSTKTASRSAMIDFIEKEFQNGSFFKLCAGKNLTTTICDDTPKITLETASIATASIAKAGPLECHLLPVQILCNDTHYCNGIGFFKRNKLVATVTVAHAFVNAIRVAVLQRGSRTDDCFPIVAIQYELLEANDIQTFAVCATQLEGRGKIVRNQIYVHKHYTQGGCDLAVCWVQGPKQQNWQELQMAFRGCPQPSQSQRGFVLHTPSQIAVVPNIDTDGTFYCPSTGFDGISGSPMLLDGKEVGRTKIDSFLEFLLCVCGRKMKTFNTLL